MVLFAMRVAVLVLAASGYAPIPSFFYYFYIAKHKYYNVFVCKYINIY